MQTCPNCSAQNQDAAKFCAFCGHSLTSLQSTGAVLQGRYRVTQLLGQGGMGAVYQAQDTRLGGRPVAVKENFDASAEAQVQFKLEATMLANLNHPHLPRVIDHFIEPSGKQYLVMDFVEGEDLEQMLVRQGRLPESRALRWFDQVCDAVEYMHGQHPPIIHRDIKPANIKVTPAGQALLVDFGIAKVYQRGQRTMAAARAVTPGFSPPEQYGGAPTDARSDIYALGATLYCMLTCQAPPDGMDRLTAGTRLTPPQQITPAVSSATEGAILWSMELNPTSRPQTVRELRQALGKQSHAYGVSPIPAPAAPSVQPVPKPMPMPAPSPAPVPAPAPVAAPFQFAGFGQRFAAALIDGLILLFVTSLLAALIGGSNTSDLANLLLTIVAFSYYTYLHARTGQTLGKKAMRIKVVRTDGSPVSTGRSAVRSVGYWISSFILLLGYLWVLWDQDRQAWHDKIADTYVIHA